jgi:hypothetical protein
MTVAVISLLGVALFALVGLVERRQATFEAHVLARLDNMTERLAEMAGRLDEHLRSHP